eukprot:6175896-Pleurochrysis_carterae.AAC.1
MRPRRRRLATPCHRRRHRRMDGVGGLVVPSSRRDELRNVARRQAGAVQRRQQPDCAQQPRPLPRRRVVLSHRP